METRNTPRPNFPLHELTKRDVITYLFQIQLIKSQLITMLPVSTIHLFLCFHVTNRKFETYHISPWQSEVSQFPQSQFFYLYFLYEKGVPLSKNLFVPKLLFQTLLTTSKYSTTLIVILPRIFISWNFSSQFTMHLWSSCQIRHENA